MYLYGKELLEWIPVFVQIQILLPLDTGYNLFLLEKYEET